MRMQESLQDVNIERTIMSFTNRFSIRIEVIIMLVALVLCVARSAHAQSCAGGWLYHEQDQIRPGIDLFNNRTPDCVIGWDPDGEGPLQEWIIVGGLIDRAGNTPVANIAAFDGITWRALGAGFNNRVRQLVVLNGELYAAGAFTASGATLINYVARWDGTAWQPVGVGPGGNVNTMHVWNGQIVASNDLAFGNGNVKIWNGSIWTNLGNFGGQAAAFITYNGQLVAASSSSLPAGRVAVWDGLNWVGFGTGINGFAYTLEADGNNLYVGGVFTTAGGNTARNIARWDGSAWHPLGSGTSAAVQSVKKFGDDLVACGSFITAGGVTVNSIAKWDGAVWSGVSTGFSNTANEISVIHGKLHVVGSFTHGTNGIAMPGLAVFHENVWQAVSSSFDSYVLGFQEYQEDLYAYGWFTSAGGIYTGSVAKWDGLTWEAVGNMPFRYTYSLTEYNGELIAAGAQLNIDGSYAWRVIRFDGSTWVPLINDVSSTFNGPAVKLIVYNGDLYASGTFTNAGGIAANNIARWNGVAWSPLQQGLTGVYGSQGAVLARALAVYNNELYVGGAFVNAGSVTNVNHVARWNGTTWSRAGTPNGYSGYSFVSSLAVYSGQLYATGNLLFNAGWEIGRWNGTAWSAISNGLSGTDVSGNTGGRSMCVHNGKLYVGGVFTNAGSVTSQRIARWTGSAWQVVGTQGLGSAATSRDVVAALASYKGELVVGGIFAEVNGVGSGNFARFSETGIPWIASHPEDISICDDETAQFQALIATGYANVTYRWQIEVNFGTDVFVDITNDVAPGIGAVSGANSSLLTINTSPLNAGFRVYKVRMVAMNTCGEATSDTANLFISAVPTFVQQPESVILCPELPEELVVPVVVGPELVSYNLFWQIEDNNSPDGWRTLDDMLGDEPLVLASGDLCGYYRYSPEGLVLSQFTSAISGARLRALVNNGCGSTTSEALSVTICIGDFNCDGGVDGADVSDFFLDWVEANPKADVNEDGGVDGSDVSYFFERWSSGC